MCSAYFSMHRSRLRVGNPAQFFAVSLTSGYTLTLYARPVWPAPSNVGLRRENGAGASVVDLTVMARGGLVVGKPADLR